MNTNLVPMPSDTDISSLKHPSFDDLRLLSDISQLLLTTHFEGVIERVVQIVMKMTAAQSSRLYLIKKNPDDDNYWRIVRRLIDKQPFEIIPPPVSDSFVQWVYEHQCGDIVKDTLTDTRWKHFTDEQAPIRSAMCIPIRLGTNIVALFMLYHPQPNHFTPFHLRTVTIVGNQVVSALRNVSLYYEMRDHQEQLSATLQALQESIIVIDHHHMLVLVNHAARQLLGLTLDESVEHQLLVDYIAYEPMLESVMGNIEVCEPIQLRSERLQRDFHVSITSWVSGDEEEKGHVIVLHDVTALGDLGRFKDEMLRVATHDLRSPLALISGYTDMIGIELKDMEPTPSAVSIQQHLEIIKGSTDRMGRLVEDLLRVERVRKSPLEMQEQTDLAAMVKLVIVNTRLAAQVRAQSLTREIDLEFAPRITVDAVLLRQSMENLISNAIKYTPTGGQVHVHSWYSSDRFYFSVTDNGIGIPEKHLPYLFESFYRVDGHNGNHIQGNGLGLSLVKNVIQRHGGDVWVDSVDGEGSTFGFWIPAHSTSGES